MAERQHIARTVGRVPEVVVKISGGGRTAKQVAEHLRYIGRRGDLELETDEGERLNGRAAHKEIVEDWDLDLAGERAAAGRPLGRQPAKLVHNIIFSMPPGTPPDKLLAAVRVFAQEEFALRHRYVMALHTDEPHPHVHLVVKAMSEQGERLNPSPATLREWRREFARRLREQGIEANATERAVRGESKSPKKDGIYRAMRRGASTHMRERASVVVDELSSGQLLPEAGKAKLIRTRRQVEEGWTGVARRLEAGGHYDLAARAKQFVAAMAPARTEKEQLADVLRGRQINQRIQEQARTR